MKKTLLFSLVALGSMAYAQKKPLVPAANALVPSANAITAKPETNTKTLGVTLWSDNFDNAANWTVDNSGQSGIDYGWNINNTSDGWWSANGITSTGLSCSGLQAAPVTGGFSIGITGSPSLLAGDVYKIAIESF